MHKLRVLVILLNIFFCQALILLARAEEVTSLSLLAKVVFGRTIFKNGYIFIVTAPKLGTVVLANIIVSHLGECLEVRPLVYIVFRLRGTHTLEHRRVVVSLATGTLVPALTWLHGFFVLGF